MKYNTYLREMRLFRIVVGAILIAGLLPTIAAADPIAFTDYGSGTTIELEVGKGIWQINWGQGPWTWSDSTDAPLLNANVSGILDLHTTAPAEISADLLATLPIAGTLTLSAHDAINKDVVIGTMVLSGTGINVIDINAGRVIMDEGSGMCLAPFPAPAPRLALALEEATGVFAYIEQTGDWELSFAGSYAAPLIEGMDLQDNIFAALGGNVPVIGGIGTFALSGEYTPNEAKKANAFCAFGEAHATSLAPSAGAWAQTWDGASHSWFTCPSPGNRDLLADDVVGLLETHATGLPVIDEDYMLHLPLAGTLTLTDYNDADPNVIDGQIVADIETVFVADLNAERATIDVDGNVVAAFGAAVQDPPVPAKVTVKETTGIYANIQPISTWSFYINGTITSTVISGIPLQQSIFAGMQDSTLLLGAEEDVVLTGWYINGPAGE